MINHSHNHAIDDVAALRLLSPTAEVVRKFELMFREGYTPSEALHRHKAELELEYGDELTLNDRSLCPETAWVFQLYYKTFRKIGKDSCGKKLIESLKNAVVNICDDAGDECAAAIITHEDFSFTIALALPFMKKICATSLATDICYMDSTGKLDRHGCRVFLIMCCSGDIGLPLGVVVTTRETEEAITEGIDLYNSLLDRKAFGGRGDIGPRIFMTNCSDVERNSLKSVYPETTLMLCIFHILQTAWRWLLEEKNGVDSKDQPQLYQIIKRIVCAKEEYELESLICDLKRNPLILKYKNFKEYIQNWIDKKKDWAFWLTKSLRLTNQSTYNIVEAGVKVFKERILDQTRALSPVQLLEYVAKDFQAHCVDKLSLIGASRDDGYLRKRIRLNETKNHEFKKLDEFCYLVRNIKKDRVYLLNLDVGVCTCRSGDCGGLCKHYHLVRNAFNVRNDVPKQEESECIEDNRYVEVLCDENSLSTPISQFSNEYDTELSDASLSSQNMFEPVEISVKNEEEKEISHVELIQNFRNIARDIENRCQENPSVLVDAMAAFCKQYSQIKSDESLASALNVFGKIQEHC